MSALGVYHDECRGYHEYSGVFSTLGDITSTLGGSVHWGDTTMYVGVIMSTPGVFSTLEGYHEYTGGFWYE